VIDILWRYRANVARPLSASLLMLFLSGCSVWGGSSDPDESALERLREPPNVLAARNDDATPSVSDNAVEDAVSTDALSADTPDAIDPASYLQVIEGEVVLDLGLPTNAAWAILGRALDRGGFALLSSDRESFSHHIRYNSGAVLGDDALAAQSADNDDNGMLPEFSLSSLAFWRSEPLAEIQRYRLTVTERGKGSRVRLQTPEGEPTHRAAAQQVLAVLAEQLKP